MTESPPSTSPSRLVLPGPPPVLPAPVEPAPADCWPRLIAMVEAGMQPAATLDIRQSTAARKLRDTVLAMLRNRAAKAGPLVPTDAHADFDAASTHLLDSMARMQAVLEKTPPKFQAVIREILASQTRALLALAGITLVTDT